MDIVSGSFGVSGDAYLSKKNELVIKADADANYPFESIASVSAETIKEKKFSVGSFLLGSIFFGLVLGLILFSFLGVLGFVIGVIAAVVISSLGSSHSKAKNVAKISFDDGKFISVVCTKSQVKELVSLNR